MSLRVTGIVLARAGSRRVAGKNMALLGGKTLVRRALETAAACDRLESVVLSSDDARILAEADGMDRVLQVERPAELASDTARSFDAVVHALAAVESADAEPVDAVAIVQCTSPFTEPDDISAVVDLAEHSGAGSAVSVTLVDHLHPLKLKRMEGDRLLPLFDDDAMTPSHELPEVFVRNGAVYVARRTTLATGSLVSADVRGHVMPAERSVDIDTPVDLEFARFLLEHRDEARDG